MNPAYSSLTQHPDSLPLVLGALRFAAERHAEQRRKDCHATPYINHPIQVAETLWRVGGLADPVLLASALLHDTVEDTATTLEELAEMFGPDVAAVVAEVSDDKSLPKAERKRRQVEHAAHLSWRARQLKLADKICNVYDIIHAPPQHWDAPRKCEYLEWTAQVVTHLRGSNPGLEDYYDQLLTQGLELFKL